jgi:hypothetical protein
VLYLKHPSLALVSQSVQPDSVTVQQPLKLLTLFLLPAIPSWESRRGSRGEREGSARERVKRMEK